MARRRYQSGYLKLENGKWKARWREDIIVDGQIQRTNLRRIIGTIKDYPTERLARRALNDILAPINDRSYRPLPVAKFSEFAHKWQLKVLPNLKPSTQPPMRSQLKRHILPRLGTASMKDIDAELMQSFVTDLKTGPKTAKNIVSTLRIMWNSAKTWKYVNHDPFEGLVLPDYEAPEQPCYKRQDVIGILATIDPHYHLAIWLAVQAGIRRGELCALNIGDFDFDEGIVTVRRSCYGTKITNTKSKRPRTSEISPSLCAHLKQQAGNRAADEPMLLTREGKRLHPDNFSARVLRPVIRALKLKGGLHAFRHGNATAQDVLKVPMKVRQERLGHVQERTTMGYTHLTGATRVSEMIDDYFGLNEYFGQLNKDSGQVQ